MKKLSSISKASVLAAMMMVGGPLARAVADGETMQQALYLDEVEGDIPAAIAAYENVANDPDASEANVAQALYRGAMCHLKLDEKEQATVLLTRLVSAHPGQTKLVELAKPKLADLKSFSPATLMPTDTLAYLELGQPGKQFERLLEMLKNTPYENPLKIVGNIGGKEMGTEGNLVASLLNPSMIAEFQKIRSIAVGVTDVGPRGPSGLVVLHPGESDALRGILLAGLGMAGKPTGLVEGMNTLNIQGQAAVAYDDQVILLSYPPEKLPSLIGQYKHPGTEKSLASNNPSFALLDKNNLHSNAATLWVDADDLNKKIGLFAAGDKGYQKFNMAVQMSGVDDLILSQAIQTDGMSLDLMTRFQENGPSIGYQTIHTPAIKSKALNAIPSGVVGLVSLAPGEPGSLPMAQLKSMVMGNLGIDLSDEIIRDIQQIVLFALPVSDLDFQKMPVRPGLVLQCRDAKPVADFLRVVIAKMNTPIPLQLEQSGDMVFVALDQAVVDAAVAAQRGRSDSRDDALLANARRQCEDGVGKLVIVNMGEVLRIVGLNNLSGTSKVSDELVQQYRSALSDLSSQMHNTLFSLHTEEDPRLLSLKARIRGVPPLSQIIDPITRLSQLDNQISSQKWAKEIKKPEKVLTATVMRAPSKPVIDGEADEIWQQSSDNPLTKVLEGSDDPKKLAANYRMMWDDERLYLLIDVTDSTPNNSSDMGWQFNDSIELYLDATDAKSATPGKADFLYTFRWSQDHPTMEEVWHNQNANVDFAMKTTSTGYCTEVSIPWKTLGVDPKKAGHLGVDVQVNDNRGGRNRDAKLSWQDENNLAWKFPSVFGHAELAEGNEQP